MSHRGWRHGAEKAGLGLAGPRPVAAGGLIMRGAARGGGECVRRPVARNGGSTQPFRPTAHVSGAKGSLALTRDLDRTSPLASTQTYSAMRLPFWSSFMYLLTCASNSVSQRRMRRVREKVVPSRSATRELRDWPARNEPWLAVVVTRGEGQGAHHDCDCLDVRREDSKSGEEEEVAKAGISKRKRNEEEAYRVAGYI